MQICKEINKAANILADFIQDTAGACGKIQVTRENKSVGFTTPRKHVPLTIRM